MDLLDLPDDVLYTVFKELPKRQLGKISTLCPRFWELLSYTQIWKNTCIAYPRDQVLPFEELFTGPCPIKELSLEECTVNPPLTKYAGETVKVAKLILTNINANSEAMTAIFGKYSTKKLILDSMEITAGIAQALSNTTHLEELSLKNSRISDTVNFTKVLKSCTSLKVLDLSLEDLNNKTLDSFCANLPESLETLMLNLEQRHLQNKHLRILLKKCPNLKELGLPAYLVKSGTLSKFRHIDTLHVSGWNCTFRNFRRYLMKLSSLRRVYLHLYGLKIDSYRQETGELKDMMKPFNIHVETKKIKIKQRVRT